MHTVWIRCFFTTLVIMALYIPFLYYMWTPIMTFWERCVVSHCQFLNSEQSWTPPNIRESRQPYCLTHRGKAEIRDGFTIPSLLPHSQGQWTRQEFELGTPIQLYTPVTITLPALHLSYDCCWWFAIKKFHLVSADKKNNRFSIVDFTERFTHVFSLMIILQI